MSSKYMVLEGKQVEIKSTGDMPPPAIAIKKANARAKIP